MSRIKDKLGRRCATPWDDEIPDLIGAGMEAGCTLWFTGMPGSGKTTLSCLLATRLRAIGARVEVLDGDVVRTQLCRGLGFTRDDRRENIRRIGFVCELLSRNGVIAIAAAISPYRACRDEVRARIPNFIEIYMCCPLEVLVERDVKGLYKRAIAGEIPNFTGISDPYEPPLTPEVMVDSSKESLEASLIKILSILEEREIIRASGNRFPARQSRSDDDGSSADHE